MNWQRKIEDYCRRYDIPIEYLADTVSEPKVVPMIRGKAFEFSALLSLQQILSREIWEVRKIPMNAQQGSHDIDVEVIHRESGRSISIECKLAAKGKYRKMPNGESIIPVKCMRSRTLGAAMVESLAPQLGVSREQLTVHNDQYIPGDFDIVLTSIGNSYFETDPLTGQFIWQPSADGITFLESIGVTGETSQALAYNKMYVADSRDIAIQPATGIRCTRKNCQHKEECGFIPNYPIMKFGIGQDQPEAPWFSIDNIEPLLLRFVS